MTASPDRTESLNARAGWLPAGAALLLPLLLLAACSGEPASDSPLAEPLAEAPAPLPPAPAALPAPASELPGPAPGRWSYTVSVGGKTMPAESRCILDPLSFREAHILQTDSGLDCADYRFRQEGASILGSYACKEPSGGAFAVEVTATGNMSTAYTTTVVATPVDQPAGAAAPTSTTIVSAERTGPCSDAPPPPLIPVDGQ